MNMKRILGFIMMLLGFLFPFQIGFLSIDEMNNVMGLVGLVGSVGLLFGGYALVDASWPKPSGTPDEEH